jgi:hypothetical protein
MRHWMAGEDLSALGSALGLGRGRGVGGDHSLPDSDEIYREEAMQAWADLPVGTSFSCEDIEARGFLIYNI